MKSTKRFSLPRKKRLDVIEINNCRSIERIKELPQGITGYTGYYQAKQCEAKLDKTKIKKSENNTEVDEARIFCDRLQSPIKGGSITRRTKAEFVRQYGQSKGEYYYGHETFSYEGRQGNTCEVAMKIKDPNNKIVPILYESDKIYLSKPRTK